PRDRADRHSPARAPRPTGPGADPGACTGGGRPLKRPGEPLIGWRLWRLQGASLQSWGVDYHWRPGVNSASCISTIRACVASPGKHCQCGFWALWSPLQCLARAQELEEPPWHVLGLITAWGTVALHGREGFRAQHASVTCLFTDWAGSAPVPRL